MASRNYGMVPVFSLRREIDRLFEDAFGNNLGRGTGGLGGTGMRASAVAAWTPAVDVREDEQEISLDLELPGISPDQVELSVENGVLTVRGEKREDRDERDEQGRYHIIERSYGTFVRSFQLPQGINEEQIAAEFNNGVLRIHVPKAALPQPRKIQIGGGRQQGQQVEVQQQSHQQGQLQNQPPAGGAESQGQQATGRSSTGSRGKGTGGARGEGGNDRMVASSPESGDR
jgi:HSP20 family protein